MAEWLVEEGIAEHRAVLVERGQIIAARLDWPGSLKAGLVDDAVLVSRQTGSARGTARFATGEQALVRKLPREASEGAALRLLVTRAAIAERGRFKLAQARPSDAPPCLAPSLAEALDARVVPQFEDWDELWSETLTGEVTFPGGSLTLENTAALTVIDVDGTLPPGALALTAVPALAAALRRFDLTGSIMIDFPTLPVKAERQAVDAALAEALTGWPHERTAMNGFGLVQLVARRERPSLLDLIALRPVQATARLLLRRAERVRAPGALLLTAHPLVRVAVRPEWEAELARRTGRNITWREDPCLAPEAAFAQAVPR